MSSYIARLVTQCFPAPAGQSDSESELSPRERAVLEMMVRGFLYKEIAHSMGISIRTVDTYVRRIYEKLHVRSRAQAVAKFINISPLDEKSMRAQ